MSTPIPIFPNSTAASVTKEVSLTDFVDLTVTPPQYTETPTSFEMTALFNALPNNTLIDDFIYISPLGRSVLMPVGEDINGVLYVEDNFDLSHLYTGVLNANEYANFRPGSVVRVLESDQVRYKQINSHGTAINISGGSGGSGGTGGVTQSDLSTAMDVLRAEIATAISNEALARQAAINNNPDSSYNEISLIGSNAPAVGVIPDELTNLPATEQEADDVAAIVYNDFRVFYEATPWQEKDRIATATPSSTLPVIGGAGNTANYGYFTSPDTGIRHLFTTDTTNPTLDPSKLISDADAPNHFIWLGRFLTYPFDPAIAHFYIHGTTRNTYVFVDRKKYYFVGTAAQKLVQPVDQTTVGGVVAGWEYTGVE